MTFIPQALRRFGRQMQSSVLLVLLSALGIALSTTLFAVLKTTLFDPLPYRDADRLTVLWGVAESFGIDRYPFSWDNYRDYRDQIDTFEGLAAWRTLPMTLEGESRPVSVTGARVTANFFDVLGIEPLVGTGFDTAEAAADRALIGYGLWQREFAAAADVVGQSIRLNGTPHTIVGVVPPHLRYPTADTQVFVPLHITAPPETNRAFHFLRVLGRLREDRSLSQAQEPLEALAAHLAETFPDATGELTVRALPLKDEIVGTAGTSLQALFGGTQLLFVIAWANVAILLLARGMARRNELELRIALGATRSRLLGQLLGESLALAGVGCALGLLASWAALSLLPQLDPALLPRAYELRFDPALVPWAAGLTLVAVLVFGGVPAWLATGGVAGAAPAGRATDRRTARFTARLVAAQVALALPLLVAAGTQLQNVRSLARVDVGFPLEGALTAGVSLPRSQFAVPQQKVYIDRALLQLEGLPGVEAVGAMSHLPFSRRNASIVTYRPEQEGESGLPNAHYRVVSPGLLTTLGIPIVAGRDIAPEDDDPERTHVVVDEELAQVLWPDRDPIGRQVRLGAIPTVWTVVGVAASARLLGLDREPEYTVYVPVAANQFSGAMATPRFVIHSAAPAAALAPAVREVLQKADPHQAVLGVRALSGQVDDWLGSRRALSRLLWVLAVAALTLAAAGMYATLAFAVGRRLREMAIRSALGARAPTLARSVLLAGLRPWMWGAVLGTLASFGASRALVHALGDIPPIDSSSVAAAVSLLLLAAVTASLVPARRAMTEDPARLLRDDGRG